MSDLLTADLNYLAILVAGISNMVIGFLWYGPIFGKMWMGLIGKTADELSSNPIIYSCLLLALALDGGRALHLHSPRQREHPIDDYFSSAFSWPCLHGLASSARRRFRTTCTQGSRSGSL